MSVRVEPQCSLDFNFVTQLVGQKQQMCLAAELAVARLLGSVPASTAARQILLVFFRRLCKETFILLNTVFCAIHVLRNGEAGLASENTTASSTAVPPPKKVLPKAQSMFSKRDGSDRSRNAIP